jgi:hypothetical protein
MPAGVINEVEQVDNDFVPDDALPVCPNCLKPCNPLQNYCDSCGSNEVINPLTSYMPFVRIRFNIGMYGKLWRKIWGDEDMSIMLKLILSLLLILMVFSVGGY